MRTCPTHRSTKESKAAVAKVAGQAAEKVVSWCLCFLLLLLAQSR